MPMQRDVYPLELSLPDGKRAAYIPGTRPARYSIDGEISAIDVEIPEDLAATGWYWSGSFFYQPWQESANGPGVAICTATYPPPGFPQPSAPMVLKSTTDEGRARVEYIERGTCFDAARRLDAMRVEVREKLAAKPVRKARRKRAAPVAAAPVTVELEQAVLF